MFRLSVCLSVRGVGLVLQGVHLGTLLAVQRLCSGSRDPAPHRLEFPSSGSDLLFSFPPVPVMPLGRSECAALTLA